MSGTAEAVEALRIRVGTTPEILDAIDATPRQSSPDIPGEIEQAVPLARCRRKEARVAGICGHEGADQIRADLVIPLADHRSEGRNDAALPRPHVLHRSERRLD